MARSQLMGKQMTDVEVGNSQKKGGMGQRNQWGLLPRLWGTLLTSLSLISSLAKWGYAICLAGYYCDI